MKKLLQPLLEITATLAFLASAFVLCGVVFLWPMNLPKRNRPLIFRAKFGNKNHPKSNHCF